MKFLLSLNAGLIALQAAIPQLAIADDYKSALAVVCSVAIAMISTYAGPQALRGLADKVSQQAGLVPPQFRNHK